MRSLAMPSFVDKVHLFQVGCDSLYGADEIHYKDAMNAFGLASKISAAMFGYRSMRNMFSAIGASLLLASSAFATFRSMVSREQVEAVIHKASTQTLAEQAPDGSWVYPSHLGLMYISQYYLLTHWLGFARQSRLDVKRLEQLILRSQREDGSWEILHDDTHPQGDINATIYHYWVLKVMGHSRESAALSRARKFILRAGGIEKSALFTRAVLSLFNNLPWRDFPLIPDIIFKEWFPIRDRQLAQWVRPHLSPMTFFRQNKVARDLGPTFHLEELRDGETRTSTSSPRELRSGANMELLENILSHQKPHGSFGGYTSATLLSMVAIEHLLSTRLDLSENLRRSLEDIKAKAFHFVENLYVGNFEANYFGVTCDGRYWDTALVAQGLLDAGTPPSVLSKTVSFLRGVQSPSGGYGFGYDFENYEDTDDTAEILLFYQKAGLREDHQRKALHWLLQMQNDDGGWGAFDRNNNGNFVLRSLTKRFQDSADIFDESSADVTGHILEALGSYSYSVHNSEAVVLAVNYLRKTQTTFGGWEGRWGVNYLYGTSAAVIGLLKAGVSVNDPMVVRALNWLESCSNSGDGGFGESFYSYTDSSYRCGGRSTPSQTAWVILALIEGTRYHSPALNRAVTYLVQEYEDKGRWIDRSFVGTGHPRIVPMSYPVYPKSFTLMALGRYLKVTQLSYFPTY